MKKRSLNPTNKTERIKLERDPIPWRYCLLTLICGLILVGGFFLAARQHFSSMDYGIKNAKLRQSREYLEAEQRRLYLTKEISLSPTEIKKVAKKIGLLDITARSIEILSPKKEENANQPKKIVDDNKKQNLTEKQSVKEVAKTTEAKSVENKPTVNTQNSQSAFNRPRIAKK
jgi:hypothetical protein